MNATEIIVTLTALVEAGLAVALVYRSTNPEPEPASYPHIRAESKKFYRSRQRTDGTWEIG